MVCDAENGVRGWVERSGVRGVGWGDRGGMGWGAGWSVRGDLGKF